MSNVVVLNDGETYTSLNGCTILDVPDDVEDTYEGGCDGYVKDHKGTPILDSGTISIELDGETVTDVAGLPDGWDFMVTDKSDR